MDRIVIIADDLTGACDTGIKFRNRGIETKAFMPSFGYDSFRRADESVIAINTNTRSASPEEAGRVLCEILRGIGHVGDLFYYKKIDSVLRGNIAQELDVLFAQFRPDFALIAPAFPENNRRLKDGVMHITGEDGSSATIDALEKLSESADHACDRIPLAVVREGWQAIVQRARDLRRQGATFLLVDTWTEEDLGLVARAIGHLGRRCLPVGSAGLAGHLAEMFAEVLPRSEAHAAFPKCRHGVPLVAVGTRHPQTVEQVQWLKRHVDLQTFLLPVEGITRENMHERLEGMYRQMDAAVGAPGQGILLTSDLIYHLEERNRRSARRNEYNPALLDAMSLSVERLYRSRDICGMIVTGGDMSNEVLTRLEMNEIHLYEELLPGVVMGEAAGEKGERLPLIIKSGGFGGRDALKKMYDYIAGDLPARQDAPQQTQWQR